MLHDGGRSRCRLAQDCPGLVLGDAPAELRVFLRQENCPNRDQHCSPCGPPFHLKIGCPSHNRRVWPVRGSERRRPAIGARKTLSLQGSERVAATDTTFRVLKHGMARPKPVPYAGKPVQLQEVLAETGNSGLGLETAIVDPCVVNPLVNGRDDGGLVTRAGPEEATFRGVSRYRVNGNASDAAARSSGGRPGAVNNTWFPETEFWED